MIFYFTGTGNSLQVARILAQETGDTLVNLGKAYKNNTYEFTLNKDDNLGFVFPVYAWSTPSIVDDFLKRVRLKDETGHALQPAYCYAVISCGAYVGSTAKQFSKKLKESLGIVLNASFSVKNVDNCIYLAEPAVGEARKALLDEADNKAHEIVQDVLSHEEVHKEVRKVFGNVMSAVMGRGEKVHYTKKFHVLEPCTACRLCVDICPTNTISLVNSKPLWAEKGCTQCLACLHRCPTEAIQFGEKTQGRVRFINPSLES